MFTIDDLWKLIKYLKDGTISPGLSGLTTTLASSEKVNTTALFEQVLDQNTFSSDDYKRLRLLLIDWYSSHKTIATTQRFASDVHQLPNNHLSELFKSFGFPLGLDLVPLTSKANFFLDLVNFYKKKGTPETLVDVLDYYGFSDSDLVEYWLQKDQFGNLVFRGESVRQAAAGSTLLLDADVTFEKMTGGDPHWIQTEDQIKALITTNKINLPSKSPYFSLSSIFSLHTINISIAIVFRVIRDQYDRYMLGRSIPYNIPVKNLGFVVPILHVYIATIYAFERMFGHGHDFTNYLRYGIYNGHIDYEGDPPIATNLGDIVKEYETLISRPTSKADRETKLVTFFANWSKATDTNFLNAVDAASPLLEELNLPFKNLIDSWFDIGDENYIITYLLGTIDNWIRINVNSKSPSMVITMLGLGFRDELDSIINFFKPYRARLAFMDTSFAIKNPLTESILTSEYLFTRIESSYHNEIRPPTFPVDFCLNKKRLGDEPPLPNPIPPGYAGYYSQYMWDMGTFFDIPPVEQMDEEYYTALNKQLQLILSGGSICDDVFTRIESSYHDRVTERQVYKNYDTGEHYDTLPMESWVDELEVKLDTSINDEFKVRREKNVLKIKDTIVDNFGQEWPDQFDSGYSFDLQHNRPVVKDSFYIQIKTRLTYEHINEYVIFSNTNATLTIGGTEQLSGSSKSTIKTNTINPPLKIIKSLTARASIINKITSEPMGGYNNNYDVGNTYDSGPSFDPVYPSTPPCTCNCNYCPCNCNYVCTCNCNYSL